GDGGLQTGHHHGDGLPRLHTIAVGPAVLLLVGVVGLAVAVFFLRVGGEILINIGGIVLQVSCCARHQGGLRIFAHYSPSHLMDLGVLLCPAMDRDNAVALVVVQGIAVSIGFDPVGAAASIVQIGSDRLNHLAVICREAGDVG